MNHTLFGIESFHAFSTSQFLWVFKRERKFNFKLETLTFFSSLLSLTKSFLSFSFTFSHRIFFCFNSYGVLWLQFWRIQSIFKLFFLRVREMALVNIMLLAGLGLDLDALRKLFGIIMRLTLIPTIFEVAVISVCSHYLLDFPWLFGIMLGWVLPQCFLKTRYWTAKFALVYFSLMLSFQHSMDL